MDKLNEEEISSLFNSLNGFLEKEYELHGGMMNRSFVLKDKFNNRYVLYVPTEQSNSMVDRDIEHKAQNVYFELGIAPKIVLFNEETGMKINLFIPGNSLDPVVDVNFDEVARLILTERKGPLMKEYYNPFERLLNFENEKIGLGIKDIREEYKKLRELVFINREILEKGKITLSHNDFQRSNIIARPDGVYFLIDYEFAMNNYEMYDIACFGNNRVQDGVELLKHVYKNPKIKDYEAYYLWRIFVSLQWYNVALIKDFNGEGVAHKIDFVGVANFFIENALEAYSYLLELKN